MAQFRHLGFTFDGIYGPDLGYYIVNMDSSDENELGLKKNIVEEDNKNTTKTFYGVEYEEFTFRVDICKLDTTLTYRRALEMTEQDIKFMPIYMGNKGEETQGLCIGTENFICINKNATDEQKKASADFLYWLFSSDAGKKFVTEKLDFITPFETFDETEVPNDPLAKEVVRYMNKENTVTIPWNFTVFPSQNFKEDFGSALLSYAQGKTDFESVKKSVVESWKKESLF